MASGLASGFSFQARRLCTRACAAAMPSTIRVAFTAKHGQTRVDAERDSVRDAGRRARVQGLVDELRVHAGAGDIEGEVL